MKDRTQRDVKANYRTELEQRLGVRPALCKMDAVGYGSEQWKPYEVEEGVAIINISGVLTNDAWWWDETEYRDIQAEVTQAADDAEVLAILLRVNSPGGETDNAFETAKVLQDARKKKPMWAVSDNIAYSAGYLLASCADKIFVPSDTGGVGSIGVYSAHFDYSKALENQGVKVTLTSAGKGKTDGNPYEPLSEGAKKKIRGEVDRLYSLFVASVAKGRRMSEDSIREIGAALFTGSESAIASGLANKAGTFTDAWVALSEHARAKQKTFTSMSASAGLRPKEANMADLNKPADPENLAGIVGETVDITKAIADAKAAGFAEAGEIADLCEIAGQPAKAVAFLREKRSAADVRKSLLDDRAKAGEEGGEIASNPLPSTGATKEAKPAKSLKEMMAAKFKKEAV